MEEKRCPVTGMSANPAVGIHHNPVAAGGGTTNKLVGGSASCCHRVVVDSNSRICTHSRDGTSLLFHNYISSYESLLFEGQSGQTPLKYTSFCRIRKFLRPLYAMSSSFTSKL